MKKLFVLITASVFFYQISNAQTEKGSQTFGIDLNGSYQNQNGISINTYDNSTTQESSTNKSFGIGPAYSYFIADRLDISVSLNYSYSKLTEADISLPQTQEGKTYNGTIALRKYFMYKNKLGFRVGPYLSYFNQNNETSYAPQFTTNNYNSTSENYSAGFNLDLVYYPSKHLGISAELLNLEYDHYTINSGSQGHYTGDYAEFNFINNGLSLSVFYVFGS